MRSIVTGLYAAGVAGALMLSPVVTPATQLSPPFERFAALAIDPSTACPSWCGPVEITVTRWSTDAERRTLVDELLSGGPNAFLSRLTHTDPVGRLQTLNSTGYELRFSQAVPEGDGGRRIVLAADRAVTFWQLWNTPMSSQFRFTVIELHVDREGEGDGRLWVPGRISADAETDTIELEGDSQHSVLLTNVRPVKPGT